MQGTIFIFQGNAVQQATGGRFGNWGEAWKKRWLVLKGSSFVEYTEKDTGAPTTILVLQKG